MISLRVHMMTSQLLVCLVCLMLYSLHSFVCVWRQSQYTYLPFVQQLFPYLSISLPLPISFADVLVLLCGRTDRQTESQRRMIAILMWLPSASVINVFKCSTTFPLPISLHLLLPINFSFSCCKVILLNSSTILSFPITSVSIAFLLCLIVWCCIHTLWIMWVENFMSSKNYYLMTVVDDVMKSLKLLQFKNCVYSSSTCV